VSIFSNNLNVKISFDFAQFFSFSPLKVAEVTRFLLPLVGRVFVRVCSRFHVSHSQEVELSDGLLVDRRK
jgi:hypothetical protein